jgi:2-polyprenyl-3-methyl-5-hydroxy-6-metoxy-1,4-benzoquinol methylase
LWDSFEHIPNPNDVLPLIWQWLNPEGVLVIYTPDYNKFKHDKKHWLWSPRQHYFLYTPETLTKLLKTHAFQVASIDTEIDENGFLLIAKKGSPNNDRIRQN